MPRARWRLGQPHNETGRSIGRPPPAEIPQPEPTLRDRTVALGRCQAFNALSPSARKLVAALARQHQEQGAADGMVTVALGVLTRDGVGPHTIRNGIAEAEAVGLVKRIGPTGSTTVRLRLTWLPDRNGRMPRQSRASLAELKQIAAAARTMALLAAGGALGSSRRTETSG